MRILLNHYLAAWLLPPLNFTLLCLLGWGLSKIGSKAGKPLIVIGLSSLWLFSTPIVSEAMLDSLMPPWKPLTADEAQAVVVLSGGSTHGSLEYGGDTMKDLTLERLRYGVRLAERLRKPILVSGGQLPGAAVPEAALMSQALIEEYHVRPKWVESDSRTTHENAVYSARMLKQSGIRKVYLVTHAWHLARAIPEFERQGIAVVPAGIGYHRREIDLFSFLPSARAMLDSYFAWHEWIGRLWYEANYRIMND